MEDMLSFAILRAARIVYFYGFVETELPVPLKDIRSWLQKQVSLE